MNNLSGAEEHSSKLFTYEYARDWSKKGKKWIFVPCKKKKKKKKKIGQELTDVDHNYWRNHKLYNKRTYISKILVVIILGPASYTDKFLSDYFIDNLVQLKKIIIKK